MAREFCRVAVTRQKIPFAPHLLFPQFMNDRNPGERELAMFFNRILLAHCEAVWVYAGNLSAGMRQELQWARSLGLPSFVPYLRSKYRGLPDEAVDSIEKYVARLAKKHGVAIDGPAPGEDELPDE